MQMVLRIMPRRSWLTVTALALALHLVSCGGGQSGGPFPLCGNGRIDPGEECDDGNLSDADDCLSTCVRARCGDGFIDLGSEQCDGRNLSSCGPSRTELCKCQLVGRAAGTLSCNSECQLDVSGCGPLLLPTPTPPLMTPTATATPTPVSVCGDGLLEDMETCDTCAADCVVRACSAGPPQDTVAVNVALPSSPNVAHLTLRLAYRSDIVSLPGSGTAATVKARVKNLPSNSLFAVNDLDYALRVAVQHSPIVSGQLFTVDFDTCNGAAPGGAADFACVVEECSDALGCTCDASLP